MFDTIAFKRNVSVRLRRYRVPKVSRSYVRMRVQIPYVNKWEKTMSCILWFFFFFTHRKLIQPWPVQRRKNISLLLLLHMYYHWPHLHTHIRITIIIIIILFFAFFMCSHVVCFYCISKRYCVANIVRYAYNSGCKYRDICGLNVSLNICNLVSTPDLRTN